MTVKAKHLNAWHEDFGPVVWWTRPLDEAPWIGSPLDSDWPGYHRWWTDLPQPPTVFSPTAAKGFDRHDFK